MRIASLVPSATEMLFALGLGDQVVAVTHECDYPPEAAGKRHLTRSLVPEGLTAGEIDAAVRRLTGEGRHLYALDEEALDELDLDLIVTQAVCEVCAVSFDDVVAVADRLPSRPRVISLDPSNLDQVLSDIPRLGEATGVADRAAALRDDLERRLEEVRRAVDGAPRPSVLALEWLDPPFIGGHWVPEMIEIAGGTDVLGVAGVKSRTAEWDEIAAAKPDVVVAMPCGWDAAQARTEVSGHGPRWPRSARSASGRLTPRLPSRDPDPVWSKAPSCSPTCSTRIGLTRPRAFHSSRCPRPSLRAWARRPREERAWA